MQVFIYVLKLNSFLLEKWMKKRRKYDSPRIEMATFPQNYKNLCLQTLMAPGVGLGPPFMITPELQQYA